MKKLFNLLLVAIAILALSTAAFAGTQAANTNTVSPTLQVSVNVQKAVRLTLSTGTSAAVHCTVAPNAGGSPDYTMNFGTVDALGINAGNCNLFGPATPGVDAAIYWSDYTLNPVFTSQTSTSGSNITAVVSTDFAAPHNVYIVRDLANSATVPGSAAGFTAMSTGTPDQIASSVVSNSPLIRFIGVGVKPDNGATVLTGSQNATVTFTLTVQ